jgi:hypothetical protein
MRLIPRLITRLLFGKLPTAPEGLEETPVDIDAHGDDNERIAVAVPLVDVTAREARIIDLFHKHDIQPDVVTIMAIRRVHDRLVRYNRDLAKAGMVHEKHEGAVH